MPKLKLISLNCFTTRNSVKIKGLINQYSRTKGKERFGESPWSSFLDFSSSSIKVKIELQAQGGKLLLSRDIWTDHFGNISTTIPLKQLQDLYKIVLYSTDPIFALLGEIIPQQIGRHEKIIICDLDKTLVDSRYHTLKEIFYSLTRPLGQFPTVASSVELFQHLLTNNYHPFIVSASPHFYELSIRKWLDQNGLPQCPITLKDYRDIFSLWHDRLSLKDLKVHGNYKLHAILDILIMTGIPKSLALIGDSSESDSEIYLLVKGILASDSSAWELWQGLKDKQCFQLTPRQSSQIIRKINILKGKVKLAEGRGTRVDVQIFIRQIGNTEGEQEDIIYYR